MMLRNKTILITGATSGIGLQLVEQLKDQNRLILLARDGQKLASLAARLPNARTLEVDLADLAQLEQACQGLLADQEGLDILINNAAVQYCPALMDPDFDLDSIQTEITTNLTSPIYLIARLLPLLQLHHQGLICNINSGLGLAAKRSSAVYCATKGGLNLFSQSLGYQLEGQSIKVMQVFLPLVDTPMTQGRGQGKMSVAEASSAILTGIEAEKARHFIGKSKLLPWLLRLAPSMAHSILKRG